MAVKKAKLKTKKKEVKKVVAKKTKTLPDGAIMFPEIREDMTLEERLNALSSASQSMQTILKTICQTTAIDAKGSKLIEIVARITLIEKKLVYTGSEINKLNQLIQHNKLKTKEAVIESQTSELSPEESQIN